MQGGSSPQTLARRELRYHKLSGLLGWEKVTQQAVTGSGGTTGSDRSWTYTYDSVGRLQTAATGPMSSSWGLPVQLDPENPVAGNYRKFEMRWTLDGLGNWNGSVSNILNPLPTDGGLRRTDFEDGFARFHRGVQHRTDLRNQIHEYNILTQDVPVPGEPDPVQQNFVTFAYDGAGRLLYDGVRLYEYDHFGRCVQIRNAAGMEISTSGVLNLSTGQIGRLIVQYTYDALGRVVRAQRPHGELGTDAQKLDITYGVFLRDWV